LSPLLAPHTADIERALNSLLQKDQQARLLAMRSPIRRGWPDTLDLHGRRFLLAWCPSELEIRERLDEADGQGEDGVVILTPLDPAKIGDDVLARLPRARLEQTDRWSALRGAFRAREVDSRLRAYKWLVDLLLDRPPVGGYAPVAGGILDLESACSAALTDVLGLPAGRSDATALLEWTLNATNLDRLARLAEEARNALVARLGAEGGLPAKLILGAAAAGRGADALPVALACGVVFGELNPRQGLREAAVRLEPMVGGSQVLPEAGRALALAGRRCLDRLFKEGSGASDLVEARATGILTEIRADMQMSLSPALTLGFDARLEEAAQAIRHALDSQLVDAAAEVWKRVENVTSHDRADVNKARAERVRMAGRLALWLARGARASARDMSEAAISYAVEGGFVDRARRALRSGDPIPGVAEAYARLAEAVAAKREEENRTFAVLLRDWNSTGAQGNIPIPVERVVDAVIAPLARDNPILLLVLDGLSFAVWSSPKRFVVSAGPSWRSRGDAVRLSPRRHCLR
jgi:hypothetical protein